MALDTDAPDDTNCYHGVGRLKTNRVESFSDGVFSIVITLLIIDLKVPQISSDLVSTELGGQLSDLWPRLLSYALSFVIVGVYWVAHHHVFHYIRRLDRTALWLNLLFLMSVAFVPFPTALLGAYGDQELVVIIYGVNVVVTRLILLALWVYATTGHRLVEPRLEPGAIRLLTRLIAAPIAIYVLSTALCVVSTKLSIALFVAVPLVFSVLPNPVNRGAPL